MTITIDQTIVALELVNTDTPQNPGSVPELTPALEEVHENMPRPEYLLGATYKIKPPMSDHALYITINDILLNEGTEHEQRHPYEVFINSKNMDHFQWVVALTRVISAVFRKGGDVTFLVDELKAVFDPKGGYFKKGGFMPSLVAEIGFAIESHLQTIGLLDKPELSSAQQALIAEKKAAYAQANQSEQTDNAFPETASWCNKCNQKAMVRLDGCDTCLNCGDSKCG